MLSFRVFAELHQRLDREPALSRSNVVSIRLIQAIGFQTVTHSSARRATPISFSFNHFRTLFIVTGVYPRSSHSGTHPPPLTTLVLVLSFHALTSSPFCNPFVFKFMHVMGGCTPPDLPTFEPSDVPTCFRTIPCRFKLLH